jgi:hypothetical protein
LVASGLVGGLLVLSLRTGTVSEQGPALGDAIAARASLAESINHPGDSSK